MIRVTMRPEIVIGILCLLISTLCHVSCYGYGYHDDGTDSEGGFGYHGTHYRDTDGGRCDIVEQIGHGRSHPVYSFPPQPRAPKSQFGMNRPVMPYVHRLPPEQCTWEFEPRHGETCVLEFRSHYYERGDVDCEQQYLLIGDEYVEKRVCGFSKPPIRFTSSGSRLFLSHYRKNGYHRTMSSKIGGVVRCAKGVRTNYMATEIYYSNSTGLPPPVECHPPPTDPICNNHTLIHAPGNNSVFIDMFLNTASPPGIEISERLHCPDEVRGCSGKAKLCYQMAGAECNFTATAVVAIPDGPGVNCVNQSKPCLMPGDCGGSGNYGAAIGERQVIFFDCPAQINETCTWTVSLCIQPS